MGEIPEPFHDLLAEERTYATFTTTLPDGLPHNSIGWNDYDPEADRVLVNTEPGRRKEKNVRNDPRAGVLAPDPDSWFRWISVAGEVDEVTEEGAREDIDELARRYTGAEEYGNPVRTIRVLLKLRPEHARHLRRVTVRGTRPGSGPRVRAASAGDRSTRPSSSPSRSGRIGGRAGVWREEIADYDLWESRTSNRRDARLPRGLDVEIPK